MNGNRASALLVAALFLSTPIFLHAASAKAKFLITPTSATHIQVPTDQVATVQYRVLNQTKIARTLTMVPIDGISQQTDGNGLCANPFTLAPNQSCLLNLQINPTLSLSPVLGGPEICKTKTGTNSPDPFLCSKAATNDYFSIRRVLSAVRQRLTLNPTQLNLIAGGGAQTITVTNNSSILTAYNVMANLDGTALAENVEQNFSDCAVLKPNGTCVLTFTANSSGVSSTPVPVSGSNTRAATATIQVTNLGAPTLSVTNSPLAITVNTSGSLTITNTSTSVNACNVTANPLPAALVSASVSSIGCTGPIVPGSSCDITFTSASATTVPSTQVTIQAVDCATSSQSTSSTASVSVNGTVNLSLSPSSLTLPADGTTTGIMTITNTGNIAATNVYADFAQTALNGSVTATACDTIEPNGGTCNMVFTPTYTAVPATNFPITTSNTPYATLTGSLTLTQAGGVYLTNGTYSSVSQVLLCGISDSSSPIGQLVNCTDSLASQISGPLFIGMNPPITYAYITNLNTNSSSSYFVTQCAVDPDTFELGSYCAQLVDPSFYGPRGVAINASGTFAYITNYGIPTSGLTGTTVSVCPINQSGAFIGGFSACNVYSGFRDPSGIALNDAKNVAYITNFGRRSVSSCAINPTTGALSSNCDETQLHPFAQPAGVIIDPAGAYAYVIDGTTASVYQCPINPTTGNLTSCNVAQQLPSAVRPTGVAINSTGTILYLTTNIVPVMQCPITTINGVSTVGVCVADSNFATDLYLGITFAYL